MGKKKTQDIFETTFSEALKFIKCPKTIVCNYFQTMNDDEYDNDDFNYNKEVYYFTNSYFITKHVYDEKTMEKIITKLKT